MKAKQLQVATEEELGPSPSSEEVGTTLDIPAYMETDLMASQRQAWRNTAVQARNMMQVNHACGDKESREAWAKQMRTAVQRILQIDASFPKAKEKMKEMDELAERMHKREEANKVKGEET